MASDYLSNIEIKLINASREFARKMNYGHGVEIRRYDYILNDVCTIKLKDWLGRGLRLLYSGNAEKDKIIASVCVNKKSDAYNIHKKALEKYINFLSQEIPEIKDRIRVVG